MSLHTYFIDYTKAFDRVRHDEIIKQLTQLKIDGKDLRIIKNMYWDQKAAMRVEGEVSKFQNIKRGVRQGCVLSPDLFSLYSEIIMRNLEGHPGIKIGGSNINNLRYADDTVLIAENEKDLQQLLDIVKEESEKKGLELNRKKTEVMVVSHTILLRRDIDRARTRRIATIKGCRIKVAYGYGAISV
ncbi:retrovirus-related pol polyprotein line-1 [Plakobranchus ocellatus]|uniref:Retrovirus-related pol polyprotein line-1 n=1 Tax=Plakobranchus ocellatus TaxID=259542 RepID=A0AAV3ZV21_9GAST|nr:retrovirus-related pol polyprotein line-1 [Plakobranchus ocellatus]